MVEERFSYLNIKTTVKRVVKFTHKLKNSTKLCSTNDAKLLTVGNAFLVVVVKYGSWG